MKKQQPPQVSEEFKAAFDSGGGGIYRECTCGRVWFNYTDAGCFEEGELEDLEKKQKEQPGKYFAVDHTVGTFMLMGNEVVWDCPCNTGANHEAFLIRHARQIADYLNGRAKRLEAQAAAMKVGP